MGCQGSKAEQTSVDPSAATPLVAAGEPPPAPAASKESQEGSIVGNNNNNSTGDWSEDDYEIIPNLETLMEVAKEKEPAVTAMLKVIEAEFEGELSGLEYKFKSRESMLRKIRKMVDRKRVDALNAGKEDEDVDIRATVWSTTDALRYTILLSTERYTDAVKAAMERFQEKGMEAKELKNFWPGGDNYQGINDVFQLQTEKSSSGYLLFEVQFHTPESFKSKMNSHHFYESFRSSHDPMEKLKSWKELCDAAKKVPVPEGVMEIPHTRSNPNPGELELYCELVLMRNRRNEPTVKALVEKSCIGALSVESSILAIDELQSMMKRMVEDDLDDSVALQEATNDCHEALNIRVVFPEDSYARLAQKATWKLEGDFHVEGCQNGWIHFSGQLPQERQTTAMPSGRGSAIRTSGKDASARRASLGWVLHMNSPAEDDGVDFTDDDRLPCMVTMHTESSLRAQEQLVEKWQQYRQARTHVDRVEIAHAIRSLHESMKTPDGAQDLQADSIVAV